MNSYFFSGRESCQANAQTHLFRLDITTAHYTQTHISQPPSHGWPQTVSDGPVLMHITEKSLQEHMQHIPCTLVYHRKQLFLDTSSMESPSQSNWPEVRAVGHSSLPPPLPNHSQKYTKLQIYLAFTPNPQTFLSNYHSCSQPPAMSQLAYSMCEYQGSGRERRSSVWWSCHSEPDPRWCLYLQRSQLGTPPGYATPSCSAAAACSPVN